MFVVTYSEWSYCWRRPRGRLIWGHPGELEKLTGLDRDEVERSEKANRTKTVTVVFHFNAILRISAAGLETR